MTELLIHLFTGFWSCLFFGVIFIVLFGWICKLLIFLPVFLWNRFWRHWNIRKHGYPPPHCDADGDPIKGFTDKTI